MFTLSAAAGWFEGDKYQRYYEAAKRGFKAMEDLGWTGLDLDRAKNCIDETGVELSAILFACKDEEKAKALGAGIVHTSAHGAFLSAIEDTLAAAQKLGVKNIVVTTGNERDDASRFVQHTNVVLALRAAAELVKGSGVKLVLEPLNVLTDHKGYYLVTSQETADIVDAVDSPDVAILFDIYHQQISEGNVIVNLRRHMQKIGHIHVGDVPGRKEPGTGELNYKNIFKAIAEAGYDGFVTFECGRSTDADTVSKNMFELLNW